MERSDRATARERVRWFSSGGLGCRVPCLVERCQGESIRLDFLCESFHIVRTSEDSCQRENERLPLMRSGRTSSVVAVCLLIGMLLMSACKPPKSTFERYLQYVDSPKKGLRKAALEGLKDMKKKAIPALKRAIASKDALRKKRASIALAYLMPKKKVTVKALLMQLKKERNKFDRPPIVRKIGALGPKAKEAVPVLEKEFYRALSKQEYSTTKLRQVIAWALLQIGGPGLDVLMKALYHKKGTVQLWVADHLSVLGSKVDPLVPLLVERLKKKGSHPHHLIAKLMSRASSNALRRFLAPLQGDDPFLREGILRTARYIKGRDGVVVPALLPLLRLDKPMEKATKKVYELILVGSAFEGLGKRAVYDLRFALRHKKVEFRRGAAVALVYFSKRPKEVALDLLRALKDPDASVRTAAAWSLSSMKSYKSNILPALKKLRRDKHPAVRKAANKAIKRLMQKAK